MPANTTVHFRIEVQTDFGTFFGADRTFKTLRATHLTTGASRTVTSGTAGAVSTRLTDVASGNPLSGRKLSLFARHAATGPWVRLATRRTSNSGRASVRVTPRRFTQYEWRFSGDTGHGSATSGIQSIKVK